VAGRYALSPLKLTRKRRKKNNKKKKKSAEEPWSLRPPVCSLLVSLAMVKA
jgi:hypothetical protein